jgi:hypothetical protein
MGVLCLPGPLNGFGSTPELNPLQLCPIQFMFCPTAGTQNECSGPPLTE